MISTANKAPIRLAIDAMGGDRGPRSVVEGVRIARRNGLDAELLLVGDAEALNGLVSEFGLDGQVAIEPAKDVVSMSDKPMRVLRRGHETSMWKAVGAIEDGQADAVVSGGNTGALMAVGKKRLGMIDGVDRPAATALWPTLTGRTIVLDVGANVEADEKQLVQFAIMGEAFFRALNNVAKPSVALLNVGAEDLKGHELIRAAARTLRAADPEMDFRGFVEGDDISAGAVDVVVTDGFTGNIALKAAEGAARLVGSWVKETLTGTLNAKFGALLMRPGLKKLKARIDPSSVNGGVFLGLGGLVVKSHGGAEAKGVASAIEMAANLARRPFDQELKATLARVMDRRRALNDEASAPAKYAAQ